MVQRAYRNYQATEENNLIFSYAGSLNMDLVAQFMKLSDTVLTAQSVRIKQKKSFINALIESLQNILYHTDDSSERSQFANDCLIMVGKEVSSYFIFVGNYIPTSRIPSLQSRLRILEGMTTEELRNHYLDTLGKGEISDKGGAGLGLIRIYLESQANIAFSFDPVDANYSFFWLDIKINIPIIS